MGGIWLQIRTGIIGFANLIQFVLLAYCLLSWFVNPRSAVMRFLTRVTDPILQPIRALLFRSTSSYRWSGFAPLAAIFLLRLFTGFLLNL